MTKRKKGTALRRSRTKAHAPAKARARSAAGPSRAAAFALSADCTVAEGAAIKSGLLELVQEPTPVTLDIASVRRIDSAAMQLIAAFVLERESQGLQVQWRGAAPAFLCAARLLGVASLLKLAEPAQ